MATGIPCLNSNSLYLDGPRNGLSKWLASFCPKTLQWQTAWFTYKNVVIRVLQRISRAYRKSSLQSGNRKPPCNFACCQKRAGAAGIPSAACIALHDATVSPAAAIYYVATGRQQLQWEYVELLDSVPQKQSCRQSARRSSSLQPCWEISIEIVLYKNPKGGKSATNILSV